MSGSLGVWTLFDYFVRTCVRTNSEDSLSRSFLFRRASRTVGQITRARLVSLTSQAVPNHMRTGEFLPRVCLYTTKSDFECDRRYVMNWLHLLPTSDAGRPPLPVQDKARLLDLADQICGVSAKVCTVTGISTGASYFPGSRATRSSLRKLSSTGAKNRLIVDGVDAGVQTPSAKGIATTWSIPSRSVLLDDAQCTFNISLSGLVQCKGLEKDRAASSADACSAACCSSSKFCNVWQFTADQGCWIGDVDIDTNCAKNPSNPRHWLGGGRLGGPTPAPAAKNITLLALDASGTVVASHTLLAPSGTSELAASVDVPSNTTGTGSVLLLDGADTGIVRITLVDSAGSVITTIPTNVSFEVVSGPGRVLGVGSGDPAAHTPQQGRTCGTFAGTVKALIQVFSGPMYPEILRLSLT